MNTKSLPSQSMPLFDCITIDPKGSRTQGAWHIRSPMRTINTKSQSSWTLNLAVSLDIPRYSSVSACHFVQ